MSIVPVVVPVDEGNRLEESMRNQFPFHDFGVTINQILGLRSGFGGPYFIKWVQRIAVLIDGLTLGFQLKYAHHLSPTDALLVGQLQNRKLTAIGLVLLLGPRVEKGAMNAAKSPVNVIFAAMAEHNGLLRKVPDNQMTSRFPEYRFGSDNDANANGVVHAAICNVPVPVNAAPSEEDGQYKDNCMVCGADGASSECIGCDCRICGNCKCNKCSEDLLQQKQQEQIERKQEHDRRKKERQRRKQERERRREQRQADQAELLEQQKQQALLEQQQADQAELLKKQAELLKKQAELDLSEKKSGQGVKPGPEQTAKRVKPEPEQVKPEVEPVKPPAKRVKVEDMNPTAITSLQQHGNSKSDPIVVD